MKDEAKTLLPTFQGNLGTSYDYFHQRLLPVPPKIRANKIRTPTRRKHCDHIEIIFIRGGTGKILVNGRSYSLSAGSCGILYSWQFQEMRPNPESFLDYVSLNILYSTFMFILSAPSCNLSPILPEDKVFLTFKDVELRRCSKLLQEMMAIDICSLQSEKSKMMGLLEELLARILWGLNGIK